MPVKYTWLKILDTLKRRASKLSVRELKAELDSRGFFIEEKELADDLSKMFEAGLIDADLLATTGGVAVISTDDFSRVGITPAGARKLTMIVKI